eukprot:TRINITY_DN3353_c0_g1_i1.p1 TRINITY_DN3353_c0_g1~~TRINITY_DN3353_c0_g1_i1.p1  ORF type:complete len:581 (-),score=79.81 TRINITY_DN3353_c0_g1_i1:121-1788(-)
MCIRDRYQRRVHGGMRSSGVVNHGLRRLTAAIWRFCYRVEEEEESEESKRPVLRETESILGPILGAPNTAVQSIVHSGLLKDSSHVENVVKSPLPSGRSSKERSSTSIHRMTSGSKNVSLMLEIEQFTQDEVLVIEDPTTLARVLAKVTRKNFSTAIAPTFEPKSIYAMISSHIVKRLPGATAFIEAEEFDSSLTSAFSESRMQIVPLPKDIRNGIPQKQIDNSVAVLQPKLIASATGNPDVSPLLDFEPELSTILGTTSRRVSQICVIFPPNVRVLELAFLVSELGTRAVRPVVELEKVCVDEVLRYVFLYLGGAVSVSPEEELELLISRLCPEELQRATWSAFLRDVFHHIGTRLALDYVEFARSMHRQRETNLPLVEAFMGLVRRNFLLDDKELEKLRARHGIVRPQFGLDSPRMNGNNSKGFQFAAGEQKTPLLDQSKDKTPVNKEKEEPAEKKDMEVSKAKDNIVEDDQDKWSEYSYDDKFFERESIGVAKGMAGTRGSLENSIGYDGSPPDSLRSSYRRNRQLLKGLVVEASPEEIDIVSRFELPNGLK